MNDAGVRKYLGQDNFADTKALVSGTSIDGSFSLGPKASYGGTSGYAVTVLKTCRVPIAYLSDLFMQDS